MKDIVYFYPKGHEEHYEESHPERPERVEAIRHSLEEVGWLTENDLLKPISVPTEPLTKVHDPEYLGILKNASSMGIRLDADTYTTHATWKLALQAVGGAIAVARHVWMRDARRGFALTRPPGHHATNNHAMGFCYLNNIAIATQDLIMGEKAKRIAIVDLDLHHGNGTQDTFWERDDVFYISTHQSPLYPGTGQVEEIGSGKGLYKTLNIPFPPMSGDLAFQTAMDEIILPALDLYSPEMILVSYGFDPHWKDPLGSLLLSAKIYGKLINQLGNFADHNCDGRISLFLEGGYNLDAASACTQAVVAGLLNYPFDDPIGSSPVEEGKSWQKIIKQIKDLWKL